MDPLTIAAIRAVVALGIDLAPYIQEMVNKGHITVEQQAETLAKYKDLRARGSGQFEGPEWQVTPAA